MINYSPNRVFVREAKRLARRNQSFAKSTFAFLLLMFSIYQGALAKENIYLDVVTNQEQVRINDDPQFIRYRAHTGYQWVNCEFEGACLASGGIIISLPNADIQRWVIAGVEFKKTSLGKVSYLGLEMGEGYKVTSIQGRVKYEFIYSKFNGLVAISAYSKDGKQRVLISQSRCGFGSDSGCVDPNQAQ